jgi:tetratricopeptide (TPR) repeat protein
MTASPPPLRRAASALPLVLAWLVAAWPFVLWLVHRADPPLAVTLAQGLRAGLWTAAIWAGAAGALLCLLFPPAPAWLRLTWHRTWRQLGTDTAPLRKARADLANFESATRHLDVARLAWQRNQPALAATHVRRALELDGEIASAWHLLGSVQFATGDHAAAAAALQRAEALDPGHAFGEALLLQGRARWLLGEPLGLELLRQHERNHGGGARSHYWLAQALLQQGDRAAAVAAWRIAAQQPARAATAEEQWFRALARVRLWGRGGRP